jgi:hypothetical protein
MNRRNFLASLAAVAILDPEKLLWVPGKKKIFIPPAPVIVSPWGPIIGINVDATREAGRFHNGLRGWGDTISVLQYSELDDVCREAFNGWLRTWGYPIPTKENPVTAREASYHAENLKRLADEAVAGPLVICGTWPIVESGGGLIFSPAGDCQANSGANREAGEESKTYSGRENERHLRP